MSWANALVSVPQNHEIIALDLKSSACWVWMQMPRTWQSLCWGLSMGRARSKRLGVLLGGSPRVSGSLQLTFAGQRCFGVVRDRPCRSDFTCTSMSFLK